MASFDLSIPKLLKNEGAGFVFSTVTGEVSKYGITAATLRDFRLIPGGLPRDAHGEKPKPASPIEIAFVQNITAEYATNFYRKYFWDRLLIGDLQDQPLADKVFDLAVNSPAPSAKAFQRAINTLTPDEKDLAVNGVIGPMTIGAATTVDPKNLLEEFRREMSKAYFAMAAADKTLAPSLKSWQERLERA